MHIHIRDPDRQPVRYLTFHTQAGLLYFGRLEIVGKRCHLGAQKTGKTRRWRAGASGQRAGHQRVGILRKDLTGEVIRVI